MLWRAFIKTFGSIVTVRSLTFSLFFVVSIFFLFSCTNSEEKELAILETYNKVSRFTAHKSDNTTFDSESLNGKYWVINYFFASCEEVCPKVNRNVALLNSKYSDSREIEFVSITVDPDNDSDSVLNEYKSRFNGAENWSFLRMPLDDLISVSTKNLGVGHLSEPSLHSTRLILIDKKGMIRGYFDGLDTSAINKLDGHLKNLLN